MRIKRLHLIAFGKFANREICLRDGLNVVYGENEAGKSTLHGFIQGMLFGFKKASQSRRSYTDDQARFRPWQGSSYAGKLEYEHAGDRYLIQRNFERDKTEIFDALTGQDVTGRFQQDKRREYDFAEQHLGLSSTVFANTVWVRQLGAATEAELAAEVAGKLANLSQAGTEDISVQDALASLGKAVEQIGTARAAAKPLGRLTVQIVDLAAEASRTEDALQAVRELEQRLAGCRTALRASGQVLQAKLQAVAAGSGRLLRRRLDRARECEVRLQAIAAEMATLEPYRGYPGHLAVELTALEETLHARQEVRRELAAEAARLSEHQQRLEQQIASLAAYQELSEADSVALSSGFALYRSLAADAAAVEELAELQAELAVTRKVGLDYHGLDQLGPDSLRRVMELTETIGSQEQSETRSRLQAMQSEVNRLKAAPAGREAVAAIGFAVIAGGAAYYLRAVWPLAAGLLLAAGCLLSGYRQRAARVKRQREITATIVHLEAEAGKELQAYLNAQENLSALFQTAGVLNAREFGEKYERYQALRQKEGAQRDRVDRKERQLSDLHQRLEARREAIAGYLGRAGIGQPEPAAELVQTFTENLRRMLDYRKELTVLKERLSRQQTALTGNAGELNEMERKIGVILTAGGVPTADEFRVNCARQRSYTELAAEQVSQTALLQAILQGREIAALAAAAAALPVGADDGALDEAGVASLQAEAEQCRQGLAGLEREQAELEATIETQLQGLRSLPEIAEELAAAREQEAEMQLEAGALKLAMEQIREISHGIHREFAPLLNRRVSEVVQAITASRYREVTVTEQIAITTTSPETGVQVQISGLSAGTADQFYLAARLAIADLVTGRDNLPLILDDCFVHYDEHRLARVLEYLATLAQTRQVLLFTCRRREEELLRATGTEFNYLSLT